METKKRENVVAGLVGAFLGSLLGVACIVILGQLGYVASISGLIMAVCALKGYELLGGALTKKGAVISGILILLMTYAANRLDWAISVAQAFETDVFRSFQAIDALLENEIIDSGSYWGNLVMLYLFTLLGAVPTIINGLRNNDLPSPPPPAQGARSPEEDGEAVRKLELYPAAKGWMTPVRLSAALAMFIPFLLLFASLPLLSGRDGTALLMAFLGAALSSFVYLFFVAFFILGAAKTDPYLFVRGWDGTLWRVQVGTLNSLPEYRFTKKSGAWQILSWDRLDEGEKALAEASVLRAMKTVEDGAAGLALRQALIPLRDPELLREDRWQWKIVYDSGRGRKRMTIGKAYPNLRPVPETEAVEKRPPARWSLCLIAAVLCLAMGAGGFLLGSLASDEESGPDYIAPPPADTAAYTDGGVTCAVDSAFEDLGGGRFSDEKLDAAYQISVTSGDEESAVESLLDPISRWRMDDAYDHFRFDRTDGKDTLVSLETDGGEELRYNILTLYLKDGRTYHVGAALSEDGRLVLIEAAHERRRDEDAVRGAITYMFKSIRLESSAL